jgi:hypothetical protein
MPRPVMGRRERVRVEFGLSPELAERVYDYAQHEGLTLSQTGERLLSRGLSRAVGPAERMHPRHDDGSGQAPRGT